MREFKFRAWNIVTQKMLSHSDIAWRTNAQFNEIFCHTPDSVAWNIMQYTGLLDKNGVEIYEGDIVGGVLEDGTAGKSDVFWGYNCYQPFSYLGCRSEDLEVIGNIYENPELLEVK